MESTDRLTWLGHATVLLELDGTRLLTDPMLRRAVAHLRRAVPDPEVPDRLDGVLLSHLHRDHLDVPSLRRLGDLPLVVAPFGSGRPLRPLGVPVRELAPDDRTDVGPVSILATYADHDGRRSPVSKPIESLGFILEGRRRIYFAGDTAQFDGMADLGPIDVALLPIAGWGPSLGPGHMDPEQAAAAAAAVRPDVAIPIHWGTYVPAGLRRGREALLRDPPLRFAEHMARLAPDTRVETLQPGQSLSLA